jgi:hypothetical protein
MAGQVTEHAVEVLVGTAPYTPPSGATVREHAVEVLVGTEEPPPPPPPPPPDCPTWLPMYVWTGETCGWLPVGGPPSACGS